jgi:transcriptional regulator with XRE-family HTH domain
MKKILIGDKLRKIRRELDITQNDLAKKIRVTPGYVSKYERNDAMPSIKVLMALSKTLKISVDEILFEDVSKNGSIKDRELWAKFDIIQELPEDQRMAVKAYLDGFLSRKSTT